MRVVLRVGEALTGAFPTHGAVRGAAAGRAAAAALAIALGACGGSPMPEAPAPDRAGRPPAALSVPEVPVAPAPEPKASAGPGPSVGRDAEPAPLPVAWRLRLARDRAPLRDPVRVPPLESGGYAPVSAVLARIGPDGGEEIFPARGTCPSATHCVFVVDPKPGAPTGFTVSIDSPALARIGASGDGAEIVPLTRAPFAAAATTVVSLELDDRNPRTRRITWLPGR